MVSHLAFFHSGTHLENKFQLPFSKITFSKRSVEKGTQVIDEHLDGFCRLNTPDTKGKQDLVVVGTVDRL